MLVAVTFRAQPGREEELEALLDNPEMARRVARALGASRNALFFGDGRMVRILEFPDGAEPKPLAEVAAADPEIRTFLQRVGELAEDGYDLDDPESLEAFNRRVFVPAVYDVRA